MKWRKSLITRWLIGGCLGTAIIALTSPLFVRSYLPRSIDPIRQVATLEPGEFYRFRAEGYATTFIGPLGMPGYSKPLQVDPSACNVALWGDSQAEGTTVSDGEKIFRQAEELAAEQSFDLAVYPLARSGDDLSDWLAQMPNVESPLELDAHVILVAELSDLQIQPKQIPVLPETISPLPQTVVRLTPAFLVHAIRNVVTANDQDGWRKFRFRLGPVKEQMPTDRPSDQPPTDWSAILTLIRQQTTRPIVFVYAPAVPSITGGRLSKDDPDAAEVQRFQVLLERDADMHFVDLRPSLLAAAIQGDWPRGFHNGQISVGHFNRFGNQLIARNVVETIRQIFSQ